MYAEDLNGPGGTTLTTKKTNALPIVVVVVVVVVKICRRIKTTDGAPARLYRPCAANRAAVEGQLLRRLVCAHQVHRAARTLLGLDPSAVGRRFFFFSRFNKLDRNQIPLGRRYETARDSGAFLPKPPRKLDKTTGFRRKSTCARRARPAAAFRVLPYRLHPPGLPILFRIRHIVLSAAGCCGESTA